MARATGAIGRMSLYLFQTWMLVFARVGAMLGLLPMFSPQSCPVKLRVALSALLALLLTPFLPESPADNLSFGILLRQMLGELGIGLLLGFVCRLVFLALDATGTIIATEMGLMMSVEFNQFNNSISSVPGLILYWMALMLWFSLDLHHWMVAALQRSYTLVPLGGAHLSEALLQDFVHRTGAIFVIAVQIAAPIIGVSFVLSLVLALLGRAVPQMNVFAESFSIRTLVGLLFFGLTCTFMAEHILNLLRRLPEDLLRVTQLLGSG